MRAKISSICDLSWRQVGLEYEDEKLVPEHDLGFGCLETVVCCFADMVMKAHITNAPYMVMWTLLENFEGFFLLI